ncbi:GntR family transcriptional regulator [Desertimonas flava]|uniref:GntR family transcriptional regulator n=1 Tax=Desertimonas flava TaxID=2064846 RepID=UPI0013C44907|nr:GntR family transcriptional regulator [Desertimonas flava]
MSARRRPLRRHNELPLYLQIRDDIMARIDGGELAPGGRLESEPELARLYGVGRPTVRQAIDVLRREGLVATRRGSGTFVAAGHRRVSLLGFDGLTPSLRAQGIEPIDTVVRSAYEPPPFSTLTVSDPEWWIVERVRTLSGAESRPLCVETDAFNLEWCPDAAELFEQSGSASVVLDEGYGYATAYCDVATRAERAAAVGVSEQLQVDDDAPVLVMERLNWTAANQPIHAVRFVVATDHVPVVERFTNPRIRSSS